MCTISTKCIYVISRMLLVSVVEPSSFSVSQGQKTALDESFCHCANILLLSRRFFFYQHIAKYLVWLIQLTLLIERDFWFLTFSSTQSTSCISPQNHKPLMRKGFRQNISFRAKNQQLSHLKKA